MTYKGDSVVLGYTIEPTFSGTPTQAAQTTWLGITPNVDFNEDIEYKDYYSINSGRDMLSENIAKVNITQTWPIELQNGRVLYLGMGSIVSASAAGVYTHTITGNPTIPSIVVEAVYDGTNDFLRYYQGAKLNTLEVEAVDGGEVKAVGNFLVAKSTKSANTKSTVVTVTTKPYMFHNGTCSLAGYASFNITSFKWTLNNNLKARHTIRATDGQYAKLIIEGKREYEIQANVIIPDAATYNSKIYDDMLSGTLSTATLTLVRLSGTDQMVLTASNCSIRNAPHNIPECGEEVEIPVALKPRTCGWVVKDTISSYIA